MEISKNEFKNLYYIISILKKPQLINEIKFIKINNYSSIFLLNIIIKKYNSNYILSLLIKIINKIYINNNFHKLQ